MFVDFNRIPEVNPDDISSFGVTVSTPDMLTETIAQNLRVVSSQYLDNLNESFIKLLVFSYLIKLELKDMLETGDISHDKPSPAIKHLHEQYPDLLDISKRGEVTFGKDMDKFLAENKGFPDCVKVLLDNLTGYYYSQQHPEADKAKKAENN